MPYPASYSKTRYIEKPASYVIFRNDFFDKVAEKLQANGFSNITRNEDTFIFKGEYFRFAWNGFSFLNGITKGHIRITEQQNSLKISYHIYFYEALVLAAVFTLLPAIFYFMPKYAVAIFVIIWGILFSGNYLFAYLSFNGMIKRIIRKMREMSPYEEALG